MLCYLKQEPIDSVLSASHFLVSCIFEGAFFCLFLMIRFILLLLTKQDVLIQYKSIHRCCQQPSNITSSKSSEPRMVAIALFSL